MDVKTHLSSTIDSMNADKARYDKYVKEFLSDVQVLARITKYTVLEVKDLSIEEIIECIDSDNMEVGVVPVEPGMTNYKKMESSQTENGILNEGYITFDIRFSLNYKEKSIKVIINIEAQMSSSVKKLGYHLENRIVFYLSRLISSQKEIEFSNSNYDDIKKVYSIWICMDAKEGEDAISTISLHENVLYGIPQPLIDLDKMCGIIIRIREENNVKESKNVLIAMLEDMLSKESSNIKKSKLEMKYGMRMTKGLERSVDSMCNLSEIVEQRGIEKGIEKGIESLVETLKELDKSDSFIIVKLMEKFSLSEEKAKEYL